MQMNDAAGRSRRSCRAGLANHEVAVDRDGALHADRGRIAHRSSAAVLVGVLTVYAGCGSEPATPPQLPPPQVSVARPIQRDVVAYQEFTGRTAAIEVVDVRARVSGLLEAVHFRPSSIVRRGDLLFTIERAPYVAARNAAVAVVQTVQATLERVRSDLARLEQAIRTNAVNAQEVDRGRADVRQTQANLLGEQARLEQAELELSYTEIRAPIRGRFLCFEISLDGALTAASFQCGVLPVSGVPRLDARRGSGEQARLTAIEAPPTSSAFARGSIHSASHAGCS